jgi:putative transposase
MELSVEIPTCRGWRRKEFAVKKKHFSVEQIVRVLKQVEMGVPVPELIRQVGMSQQTIYRWKKQSLGLETDQVRQIKQRTGAHQNQRLAS